MDQPKDRPSQRALLTGAAVGAAAVAAKTLTPTPAQAADGDPVLLGQTNTSVSSTTIQGLETPLIAITATDDGALVGINTDTEGYGVRAAGRYIGSSPGAANALCPPVATMASEYTRVRTTVSAFGHGRASPKGPPFEWRDVRRSAGAAGPWCLRGRRR
jgi:hypothetical protein